MVAEKPTTDEIWALLGKIPDPEIPVLSIVDLGIVRRVEWSGEDLTIAVTPTYSGCPAMDVIVADICSSIHDAGIQKLRIERQLSPAWTTDWMSDAAKQRLKSYGIAPPAKLITPEEIAAAVTCPHCGSADSELLSRFGSTPCKALYRCRKCLEPFDAFKRH